MLFFCDQLAEKRAAGAIVGGKQESPCNAIWEDERFVPQPCCADLAVHQISSVVKIQLPLPTDVCTCSFRTLLNTGVRRRTVGLQLPHRSEVLG